MMNERIPSPKEIEKEIGEFLAKRFGGEVKIISPMSMPQELFLETPKESSQKKGKIDFNLKPEDLVAYLDQYIVKQDRAKAVLSTKICTHFNRIKRAREFPDESHMVGRIKNNVLMIGPTGVGKTYMVKLIAKKIGVPFVKGDATKFSETGYVGGDVEDLVRDLVREADGDAELAQSGIIYIDEVDKIASSRNLVGSDISRTGVQRALLKPMEETEIELKVPHDPISIMQEIEKFRRTGRRERNTINTKNILFIMSGAFADLPEIIARRMKDKHMGFGARITSQQEQADILNHVKSEDLIEFGFESEFVGRLPVRAVFEKLNKDDLFNILKNPNNPVILGKKFDFASYGIRVKFEDDVLHVLAKNAFQENTGARGLVSAIERALLLFEKSLPSTDIRLFPVTKTVIREPEKSLEKLKNYPDSEEITENYETLLGEEKAFIKDYLNTNKKNLAEKYNLTLSPSRIDTVTEYYSQQVMEVGTAIEKIKSHADEIKRLELYFYKNHDINIVMEDDAIDYIIEQFVNTSIDVEDIYNKLTIDFEYGLKLVREKTGRNRFFITRDAMVSPESYVSKLLKEDYE
jgi:endopeptidase Clp ATP-binding regulatory subunit ClpX